MEKDEAKLSPEQLEAAGKIFARARGMATLKKYGKQHFRNLVNKRWGKTPTKK